MEPRRAGLLHKRILSSNRSVWHSPLNPTQVPTQPDPQSPESVLGSRWSHDHPWIDSSIRGPKRSFNQVPGEPNGRRGPANSIYESGSRRAGPERADLDWKKIRSLLQSHLGRRADRGDREFLEDLTQEACVRFLRASRGRPVENQEALAATIAKRTWVDFIRRRTRWRKIFSEAVEVEAESLAGGFELGDQRERLQFIVQELFDRNGSQGCLDLARAFFAEMDWKSVAESKNRTYASVRKQWSRCVQEVRRMVKEDPPSGSGSRSPGELKCLR